MTEAQQRRFYFPAWNGCAVANGWMMSRGRLKADIGIQMTEFRSWPDPAGPVALQVVVFADQLAATWMQHSGGKRGRSAAGKRET